MSLDIELILDVDTGGKEKQKVVFWEDNITHNLVEMALQVGENFYNALWKPYEIHGNATGADMIPHLEEGLIKLLNDPDLYQRFNPENGWGSYHVLHSFTIGYLSACKMHPKCYIEISK